MARSLRSLFESIGATFESAPQSVESSIECIGVLTAVPSSLSICGAEVGQTVWTTGQGWIEFRQTEFESWLVDVPAGSHLLVIERESAGIDTSESPSGVTLSVWDRAVMATVIGRAVIDGRLSLAAEQSAHSQREQQPTEPESASPEDSEEAPSSFEQVRRATEEVLVSSNVDPSIVLEQAGFSGTVIQPALIEARFWLVSGCLIGPDAQREPKEWLILDDDYAGLLQLADDVALLDTPPALERLAQRKASSESELRLRLPTICDERRHQQIEPTGTGKGSLLRWWRLDTDSLEIDRRTALLPCWSVATPLDGLQLIHGISGEMIRP